MKTNKTIVCGFLAVLFALAFTACPDGGNGNNNDGGGGGGGSVSYAMVRVPGGSFQMGKELGTASGYGYSDVTPVHTVTLSAFSIGKYEVTQGQYRAVTGNNPSHFKEDNLPVYNVSWYDAVKFCNKLSVREGLAQAYTISDATVTVNWNANGYRLPTEAQWEYAAKGGNGSPGNYTYSGSNTVGDVAWYSSNSSSSSHAVGTKAPNGLGIYDMSGNLWEWCWDYGNKPYPNEAQTDPTGAPSGFYRVVRGGDWLSSAIDVRSAYRGYNNPDVRSDVGFRLVRP